MKEKMTENISVLDCDRSSEYALENLDHLPVAALREYLRQEIRLHPNFVVIAETGSGKTTCIPPLLLELRNELNLKGSIAVTQPRRVATTSISDRVASMMQTEVGDQVGYHIRFENITSEDTDITFMTDGVLLRKIQYDPLLSEYAIVMIDEAHERSLNIDLCLGLLKDVNDRRFDEGIDPVRIVITSATIERNRFAEYISSGDTKNSVEIPGKMFPVEVTYEKETPFNYDYIEAAAKRVKSIVENQQEGDILIFMPGKTEIKFTIDEIKAVIPNENVEIIPLHAELGPKDQDRIFTPSDKRKIIIATNIAETSITIDGVIHVIDSGLIKQTQFNPKSGLEQLVLVEHALSGLEQRKGRAGRTAPGYCYRLFTEESMRRRSKFQSPEIQRSNLAQVVLAMKKVGIQEIEDFDFLDHPGRDAITQAINNLTSLGALDNNGYLTDIGEWLVELSLEPRLGRMVIEAAKPDLNCVNEVIIIASFLDGKRIFVRPSEKELEIEADLAHSKFKKDKDSDFLVLLNVWDAYKASGFDAKWAQKNFLNEKALEEAKNVRLDLLEVLENHGIHIEENAKTNINKNTLHKAITAGLIGNLIQSTGKHTFRKVDNSKGNIYIHPASVLYSNSSKSGSFIISDEIFINPNGKAFACNCLEVKYDWIREMAPQLISQLKRASKEPSRKHRRRR